MGGGGFASLGGGRLDGWWDRLAGWRRKKRGVGRPFPIHRKKKKVSWTSGTYLLFPLFFFLFSSFLPPSLRYVVSFFLPPSPFVGEDGRTEQERGAETGLLQTRLFFLFFHVPISLLPSSVGCLVGWIGEGRRRGRRHPWSGKPDNK